MMVAVYSWCWYEDAARAVHCLVVCTQSQPLWVLPLAPIDGTSTSTCTTPSTALPLCGAGPVTSGDRQSICRHIATSPCHCCPLSWSLMPQHQLLPPAKCRDVFENTHSHTSTLYTSVEELSDFVLQRYILDRYIMCNDNIVAFIISSKKLLNFPQWCWVQVQCCCCCCCSVVAIWWSLLSAVENQFAVSAPSLRRTGDWPAPALVTFPWPQQCPAPGTNTTPMLSNFDIDGNVYINIWTQYLEVSICTSIDSSREIFLTKQPVNE